MPTVPALSADSTFLAALREGGFRARVHSVFARVVNLVTVHDVLFCVASRGVDNAPNTLIVDVAGFTGSRLHPGDRAVAAARFALGPELAIVFDTCATWQPALPRYPAHDAKLQANLRLVRQHLARADGRPGGVGASLSADVESHLARHAAALCEALRRGEGESACRHGRSLIGLGPGLTPSGDDFLVGLFAVLHMGEGPCAPLRSVCTDIILGARERTHAVSIGALEAAARGRVRDCIQVLLRELSSGSEASVRGSLARVLAIGSSSGRDIVRGVLCGFDVQLARDRARARSLER